MANATPENFASFTKMEKGNPKAAYNGYFYVLEKYNTKKTKGYWRCEEKNCPVRMHVLCASNDVANLVNDHTHGIVPGRMVVLDKMAEMKEVAETNPFVRPREVMGKLGDIPVPFQDQLPAMLSQYRMLQKARAKACNTPALPKDMTFVLPEEYKSTANGESLLLWDSGPEDPDRIILFSTTKALEQLERSQHLFTNSTYKACPDLFYQVWALHALVEASTIPLVIRMTSNKKHETYCRIYEHLKDRLPEFDPASVLMDIEMAHLNAIRVHFPMTKLVICLFHYCQALVRHVGSCKLQEEYRTVPEVSRFVKSLQTLAFVPPERVKTY